jgi:Fic-DOC domain mobile mystery protein B
MMAPPEARDPGDGARALTAEEQSRLLPSLSTRAQLDEIERLNVNAARVWAMRATVLQRADLLSEAFSTELHRRMFNGIWRGAGKYRATERTPGWEPKRIAEGVRMFLDDAEGWLRFSTYPVDEAAVRLHHRLMAIRPWANGNGRHARLLADVVVASCGFEPLGWGSKSEAAGPGSARARYLGAIRAADSGDMAPLLEFARD